MKILEKATAILGVNGSSRYFRQFFPLNWKEFSAKISLSALCSSRVGIGGSFLWNDALYARLRNRGHHDVTNNSPGAYYTRPLSCAGNIPR